MMLKYAGNDNRETMRKIMMSAANLKFLIVDLMIGLFCSLSSDVHLVVVLLL